MTAAPVLTPSVNILEVSIVEIPERTGVTEENPTPKLRTVAEVPTVVPLSWTSTPEITLVKLPPSPYIVDLVSPMVSAYIVLVLKIPVAPL